MEWDPPQQTHFAHLPITKKLYLADRRYLCTLVLLRLASPLGGSMLGGRAGLCWVGGRVYAGWENKSMLGGRVSLCWVGVACSYSSREQITLC